MTQNETEEQFRQSSPLCPIAVPLSITIHHAVEQVIETVPGVTGQDMEVVGFVKAEELTALLHEMLDRMGYRGTA